MKNIKYLLFAIFAIAVAGCTEDPNGDNGGGTTSGKNELYFATGLKNFFEVNDEDMTFSVAITRTDSSQEGTYEFELAADADGYIAFDSKEVHFAKGETEATVTGKLLDTAIQGPMPNKETFLYEESAYAGAIAITNKDYASLYKPTTFNFTVSYPFTWETVTGDNGAVTGIWNDGVVMSIFMFGSAPKEVVVEKAKEYQSKDNNWDLYRFTDVYTADYIADLWNVTEPDQPATAADFVGFAKKDYEDGELMYNYMMVDVTAGKAFFPYQTTGLMMQEDYGYLNFASYCDINFDFPAGSEADSKYGVYENGAISFPVGSLWVQLDAYNGTGGAWLNMKPTHTIFMPGTAEWSSIKSIESAGFDFETLTTTFDFEVSDNAASIKYAVVPFVEKVSDYSDVVAAIKDGTQADIKETTEFTGVEVTVAEAGKYVLVALPYDEKGTVGRYDEVTCVYGFRALESYPAGVADGIYSIAKVTFDDGSEVKDAEDVLFTLTRSTVLDYVYYSTDIFGFNVPDGSAEVELIWTLNPDTNVMSVEPYKSQGLPIKFLEGIFNAGNGNALGYVGLGQKNESPWGVKVTLDETAHEYTMTTFSSDAYMGLISGDNFEYTGQIVLTIEEGTVISKSDVESYAPATKSIAPMANFKAIREDATTATSSLLK